jgi:hypothetical protein
MLAMFRKNSYWQKSTGKPEPAVRGAKTGRAQVTQVIPRKAQAYSPSAQVKTAAACIQKLKYIQRKRVALFDIDPSLAAVFFKRASKSAPETTPLSTSSPQPDTTAI